VYIYAQNPSGFRAAYKKAKTDAPLLFSVFKYNIAFWPREYVEKIGNLVYYKGVSGSTYFLGRSFTQSCFCKEHARGGHFAGLDNPPALITDLREIGDHFNKE